MKRKFLALVTSMVAITSISMIVGCQSDSDQYNVTINKTSTTIGLFENEQLEITSLIPEGMTAVWTSSDENIVSVNSNGLISGLYPGSATITVTIGDVVAECHVVVESNDILQVGTNIIGNYMEMLVDSSITVLPSVFYKGSPITDAQITYESADPSVATVENGVVTGVSKGETEVLVSASYRGIEGECIISVNVKSDISLVAPVEADVYALDINEDGTTPNTYTFTPKVEKNGAEVADAEFTYQVVDERIASVDANGVVTGINGGQTEVIVSTIIDGESVSVTTKLNVLRATVNVTNAVITAERYGMIYTGQSNAVLDLTACAEKGYFNADDVVGVIENGKGVNFRTVDNSSLTLASHDVGTYSMRFVTGKANYDVNVNFVEEGVKHLSLANVVNPYGNKYSYTQYKQYHANRLVNEQSWHRDAEKIEGMDLIQIFYGNGATGYVGDYPVPAEGMWGREETDVGFSFMSDCIGDINVSDYKYLVFDMKIVAKGDGANVENPVGSGNWIPWGGRLSFGFGNLSYVELNPGENLHDKDFTDCGGKIGWTVDENGDPTAYTTDEWCTVVVDISTAYQLLKDNTGYDGLERFFRVSCIGAARYSSAVFANARLVDAEAYDFSSYEVDFGLIDEEIKDEAIPTVMVGGVQISNYELTTSNELIVKVEDGKFVPAGGYGEVTLGISFDLKNGMHKTVYKTIKLKDYSDPIDIKLDKETVSIEAGYYDSVSIVSEIPLSAKVSWSSSNENVATVTNDGKICAIAAGTAEITVKVLIYNVESTGKMIITVTEPAAERALNLADIVNPYAGKYGDYEQYKMDRLTTWYAEHVVEGYDCVTLHVGNKCTTVDTPSREAEDCAFSLTDECLGFSNASDYKYLKFDMMITTANANIYDPVTDSYIPWKGVISMGFGGSEENFLLTPGENVSEKSLPSFGGNVIKMVDANGNPVNYATDTWCTVIVDISAAYEALKDDNSFNGLERFFRVSLINVGRYAQAVFANASLLTDDGYNAVFGK